MIKCTYGHNYFGLRDSMINNNIIEEYCSQCDGVETWDHIAQCAETIPMRK